MDDKMTIIYIYQNKLPNNQVYIFSNLFTLCK